jgi:alkylation response protein AidB-like acyl-CoA dehydrogenase
MATETQSDAGLGLGAEARALLVRSIDDLLSVRHPLMQRQRLAEPSVAALSRDLTEIGLAAMACEAPECGTNPVPADLAAVSEALGRGLARDPDWTASATLGDLMATAGAVWRADDLKDAIEGHGPLLIDGSELTATATPGGWVLSGDVETMPVRVGATVTYVVVADGSDTLLLRVCLDVPGVTAETLRLVDHSTAARLRFEAVHVGADDCLARGSQVFEAAQRAFDLARLLMCAEALGGMSAMMDHTAAFLNARHQFGGPIGRFQVLQHRMADMWMARQLAGALVRGALEALQGPGPSRQAAVLAAQAFVAQSGREIAESAIQLHGAMGLTDDMPVGLYAKRILVLTGLPAFGRNHTLRRAALVDAMEDATV